MSVVAVRSGRFAILVADLEGVEVALGVLLEDPASDSVYVRLRQDWQSIAADDPVLPLLEQDLELKAAAMGAAGLFGWLEEHASANLRTSDRENVAVDTFERTLNRLYSRHIRSTMAVIPRYSLRSAAGRFLENAEVEAEGFEELGVGHGGAAFGGAGSERLFAAHIAGTSMEPAIPDGSVALFRAGVTGSRQGRLVLVEENGASYTLKKYTSGKHVGEDGSWEHSEIVLEALNPEHAPIVLGEDESRYRIVAEFVEVLY